MSEYWKILPESSEYILKVEDPEGWRSASAKVDGCVQYYRYYNTPKGMDEQNDKEMADTIHICDIDEEIARLQELKRLAFNYFEENNAGHSGNADVVDGSVVVNLVAETIDRGEIKEISR